ncbi:ATP-dependent zinc metalloprotease FtsH-like [Rattus rattus]|uniref:ATP-dependent zinc metalloprotease FtsH-like n=1 Tax=Rattus rattus TaxID=10117 RepID=UPI0013F3025B|nr:ATP-dependent zinc metalloprotease FtsH-like [Rattus rattus]
MKAQGVGGLGGPGGIFKIGQSLSKTVKSNVLFKNVAGLNEEKVELLEIVDYLKAPNKYKAMGARVPRGVILYGPPGTGKTLLAKAVSGEADVPFIEVSGATFDDMYVGSGAKRVRDLFAKAKKLAPCIVFIDEIDAVAGKRGNKFIGGGGGVYDQTINQMLSEMDGFNTSDGIVVMAATNRLDSIDDAILRPGRFDRHIQVGLPNIKDRVEILKVHSKNKNISSSVDMEDIARKTPGFSGAQLENVLNEATLLAVRNSKRSVVTSDIEEAIDRVMAGPSKKSHRMSDGERRQVAYHEAGHAIAGLYSKEGEVVEKITIIPRGQAAGYMLSAPEKQETFIKRKDELLSIVVTTLGGRASEEIFYGLPRVSTGAANDLFKVTRLVTDMITKFGMSDKLGLYQYVPSEGTINPYKNQYSEDVSRTIDEEVSRIISEQYLKAKQMIIEHAQELKLIVECLLLLETIDRNQINHIHSTMTLPPEAIKMKDKLRSEGKTIDLSPDSDVLIY